MIAAHKMWLPSALPEDVGVDLSVWAIITCCARSFPGVLDDKLAHLPMVVCSYHMMSHTMPVPIQLLAVT
jgi:hypothetical protein